MSGGGGDGDGDGAHEFPAHYKVMLDKLNEQRRLDQFTDITLIVDGHQFRAHKAVLAACSHFFHKFFQDFTQEPMVEIEGVSNTAFCHLMEFTYTAVLAVSGEDEVNDVWRAAEYLQMQEAIKALNNRSKGAVTANSESLLSESKASKRKIAETSNVITEALPSAEAEAETVEIEVEVKDEPIELQECVTEEEVTEMSAETDESALALLADITSKYQQGPPNAKRSRAEARALQDEAVVATKALEGVEGVEVVEVRLADNVFRCDKCERCFKLFYHLKQHMRSHAGAAEKPFVCKYCGKTYAREGALRQHHTNGCHYDPDEQARKLKKKVHMCVYCHKEFDHFGHFKEHLRKHTGEKPFECPDCHERFARNSTLKCHMSACQNGAGAKKGRKKLYECQVCGEVFNSWDQFKDHLVIHTGEKPNHCVLCDQWFTHPRELSVHLQQEHSVHQEERAEVQDGPASGEGAGQAELEDSVVMMEQQMVLQDGIMMEQQVVVLGGQVELQDGVVVEDQVGVVITGAEEGETVLIQVEEGGIKEQCV